MPICGLRENLVTLSVFSVTGGWCVGWSDLAPIVIFEIAADQVYFYFLGVQFQKRFGYGVLKQFSTIWQVSNFVFKK